MTTGALAMRLATLGDWADVSSICAAPLALVGLAFVVLQLRSTATSARAQATIAFQQAFRESRPARDQLTSSFPVHEDLLARYGGPDAASVFATWRSLDDLTPDQRDNARIAIAALNDVAQYVSDGLSLRSALQQYHAIFVRVGFLLYPYIKQLNSPSSPRYGVRVVELLNIGLNYHRCNPLHVGRELAIHRTSSTGVTAKVVLIGVNGEGLEELPRLETPNARGSIRRPKTLRSVIREAERNLRP
jgi:hypothetical protein